MRLVTEIATVYATRIPSAVPALFPEFRWTGEQGTENVFLTFDDGPHPEWTPRILDMLGEAGHKATFFCVGNNIEKHPAVFDRIRKEGHSWGNHTMGHESGWTTGHFQYLRSFLECEEITGSGLFRPPYGRMRRAQARAIAVRSEIVMWDILTGDFDTRRTPEECLDTTLRHFAPGSITVMHDSEKAAKRTIGVLQGMLDTMEIRGWTGMGLVMPNFKIDG